MNNFRVSILFAIVLTFAITGIYLFAATRTTLWDRDEPRFARAAAEMVTSGKYLIPTFNGALWADKPVLTYWLQALSIKLFGETEFACRFFSAIGAAITCFFVFLIGKRLFDSSSAIWAMSILFTSVMFFVIGTLATSDAVTIPFTVCAMLVFVYAIYSSGLRVYHVIIIGIALGFGMLTKGPIGLFPLPAIAVTLWLNRKNLNAGRNLLYAAAALMIGLIVFSVWAVPTNIATNGEFLRIFIGRHVIQRALKPMEHHGGNLLIYLPYYIPIVIGGFFPWIMFLPGAFSALWGGRICPNPGRAVLISWIVPVFIIMTLAVTKLPHYILFIWPALSLAVAGTINAAQQNKLTDIDRIWLRRGVWFYLPIAGGIISALMIAPWFVQIPGLRLWGFISGMVLVVMSIIACFQQQANKFIASAKTVLFGMIIFEILLVSAVLPTLEQIKITPYISQIIKTKTSADVQVATYKFAEPSLNFYIGRKIEQIREEESVINWIRQSQPGALIVPADTIADIQKRYGHLPIDEIASRKGCNYSKGKKTEIKVMLRNKEN